MAGTSPELQKIDKGTWGSYLEVREGEVKRMEGSWLREGRGVVEDSSPELQKRRRSWSSLLP